MSDFWKILIWFFGMRAFRISFTVTTIILLTGVYAFSLFLDYAHKQNGIAGDYLAARHAERSSQSTTANQYYRSALRARPNDTLLTERAFNEALASGDIDTARAYIAPLLDKNNHHTMARFLDAVASLTAGDTETLEHKIQALPPAPITKLQAPSLRLWSAYQTYTRAHPDAKSASETALRARIEDMRTVTAFKPIGALQTAMALEAIGDSEAETIYANAMKAGAARYPVFALAYGHYLERAQKRDRARALYHAYGTSRPANALINVAKTRLAKQEALPPKSRKTAQEHLAYVLLAIGEITIGEGGHKSGLFYLNLARHLDPSLDTINLMIGDIYALAKQWEIAEREFAHIEKNTPLYREAILRRMDMLRRAEKIDDAIALAKDTLATEPNDMQMLIGLGDLYRYAEDFETAETAYDRAIGLLQAQYANAPIPNNYWRYYFARGIARERSGQWDSAERDLLQARKMSNDDPHVLNYLGYSWVDQGGNLQEGLKIIAKAVKKNPNNGYFVDSLGWAYYRLGKYALAVRYLENATRLEPVDAVIADHLGDALWKTGRQIEARYQWRKALGFDPDDDKRAEIERKLIHGIL